MGESVPARGSQDLGGDGDHAWEGSGLSIECSTFEGGHYWFAKLWQEYTYQSAYGLESKLNTIVVMMIFFSFFCWVNVCTVV